MRKTPCPIATLNQVRDDSLIFNKEVFGDIRKKKATRERRIKRIQNSLERIESARFIYLEQELQQEYDKILFQGELHWYQKSREKWVKLGDINTKFFHAQTMVRRKRNKIHALHLPNGIWCTDDNLLQEEALNFFKNLFYSPSQQNNSYIGQASNIECPQLSEDAR